MFYFDKIGNPIFLYSGSKKLLNDIKSLKIVLKLSNSWITLQSLNVSVCKVGSLITTSTYF